MGYHIINITENGIKSEYVNDKKALMYLDTITEDSIIYQGEPHWTPLQVKNTEFKSYCIDWYRAGLKAQEHFKTQAKEQGLILEELIQDKESFQQYLISDEYIAIKRGDFLVRNYGNLEIDVKCRTFQYLNDGELSFHFSCKDLEKHLNMQKFTQTPIIIAIYKREGDSFQENIPYFISVDRIKKHSNELTTFFEENNNTGECYEIPIKLTVQNFEYIKDFENCKDWYPIEEMRKKYPNIFKKWREEEDDKLEYLYCERTTIKELCSIFGRNERAITYRIEKLELREKYDI